MVKQPGLFLPKFGATSSHVFTQSQQKSQYSPEFTFWPVGTGALRYHNFCIDGGTSSEYFGYHVVHITEVFFPTLPGFQTNLFYVFVISTMLGYVGGCGQQSGVHKGVEVFLWLLQGFALFCVT
jgi:hypothetical protein